MTESVTPAHVVDDEGEIMAHAAIFPGGPISIKWRRNYYPEGERSEFIVTSQYATVEDAEQCTGGKVEVGR